MGGTKTPHVYDFGFFDMSLSSKTNYFCLWRPQDTSKHPRHPKTCLGKILCLYILNWKYSLNWKKKSKSHIQVYIIETFEILNSWYFSKDSDFTSPHFHFMFTDCWRIETQMWRIFRIGRCADLQEIWMGISKKLGSFVPRSWGFPTSVWYFQEVGPGVPINWDGYLQEVGGVGVPINLAMGL